MYRWHALHFLMEYRWIYMKAEFYIPLPKKGTGD